MGAAPVKTLVAQLLDETDLNGGEVDSFWKPCMESVESWARDNGFDYKRYTFAELEPHLPDLSSIEHLLTRWQRLCISRICMFNNTAYDKIVVMDADIIIYGNPQLGDAPFGVWQEERWFPLNRFPLLPYPQCGLYYSTRGPEVYQWCCEQFSNPSKEFEYVRLTYELLAKTYPHWTRDSEARSIGVHGLCDQAIISSYIANHEFENITNHVKWKWNFTDGLGTTYPEPDSFVHFCGDKKFKSYGKWKCYLLFQKLDSFYTKNLHKLKSKRII